MLPVSVLNPNFRNQIYSENLIKSLDWSPLQFSKQRHSKKEGNTVELFWQCLNLVFGKSLSIIASAAFPLWTWLIPFAHLMQWYQFHYPANIIAMLHKNVARQNIWVRYKSRKSINRQSIYRLSPYRKILICQHVDCRLIARLSPITILKSHSPSTPLLFHFHSFNFEYDRTSGQ